MVYYNFSLVFIVLSMISTLALLFLLTKFIAEIWEHGDCSSVERSLTGQEIWSVKQSDRLETNLQVSPTYLEKKMKLSQTVFSKDSSQFTDQLLAYSTSVQ